MPVFEAEELERAVVAACAPFMEARARRRMLNRLDLVIRPAADVEQPKIEVLRRDPKAAAEWFRAMGIEAVESGEQTDGRPEGSEPSGLPVVQT